MFCGCTGNCANKRCTCRKAGIRGSNSCRNCNGITCRNASDISKQSDADDHEHVPVETLHNEETSDLPIEDDSDKLQADDNPNENEDNLDYHSDNEFSSDSDDEFWESERLQRERRYLKIREMLYNDDSEEELEDIDGTELDFNSF